MKENTVMIERCEECVKKGTGKGVCNLPINKYGYCDRASDHISTAPEAPPGVTCDELADLEEGLR